jgi:hypothetical protein
MATALAYPGLAVPGASYPNLLSGGAAGGPGAGTFRPPRHRRYTLGDRDRLWGRMHYDTGLTVLKWPDGSYQTVENVDDNQIEQASIAYLGGREYDVSEAEAAALTAAGYEVTTYA